MIFMQEEYNSIHIYEIISKSELELKEDIINFGEEAWPLTRNILWVTLTNLDIESTNDVLLSTNSFKFKVPNLKKLNKISINFLKKIFYIFSIKRFFKESEIIFFSRSVYLEKLDSGKLFDRVIDPLFFTAKINNSASKFYIDNPVLKKLCFFKALNYFPNSFIKNQKPYQSEYKELENLSIFFLKSFIKKNNFEKIENFLINEIKKGVKNYIISKNKSEIFLKKFHKLKKIFLTSWYFPDMMGIIASAKKLGIETIEVQHGKQGEFQAAYSGWSFFPNNGYLNMPNKFWCWGNKSIKNILRSSPDRKFHQPFLGGYAWPIWYRTFFTKRYYKELEKNLEIRVLFTMQGKNGSTNIEPFPDFLLDLAKYYENLVRKTNRKFFELKIRLHPNELSQNLKYLKERLGNTFDSEVISISSKLNSCIYEDLNWANHHITFYSSCALDALIFGVKSAVYGHEGFKIYQEEINNKSITFLNENSSSEIIKWIKTKVRGPASKYKDLATIIFPDPKFLNPS